MFSNCIFHFLQVRLLRMRAKLVSLVNALKHRTSASLTVPLLVSLNTRMFFYLGAKIDPCLSLNFVHTADVSMVFPLSASDELKHIIGADTTRKGILRVFDMFQYQPMNRRLVYVFLEGFLETMFPQYKFPELFVKLHSRSPRIHRYSQKLKSSSLKR